MSDRIRLLGLDLDGTLLNNKKQLSKIDEESIKEIMNRGIVVVPITGRPKKGILHMIENLFYNSYMITSNGAVTTDAKIQKIIDSSYMNSETVVRIVKVIQNEKEDIQVEVFANGTGYVQKNHLEIIKEKYRGTPLESYILSSRTPVKDMSSFISDISNDIEGISIMTESVDRKNNIQNLLAGFPDIKITSSVSTDLEINAAKAGKGVALLNLAKRLGIDNSEIMACGDSGNDIEMLELAAIGVAMGNAEKRVKRIANFITLSNEENGVAYAIEKFILN